MADTANMSWIQIACTNPDSELGLHERDGFNPNGERYFLNQSPDPADPDYVEITYAQYRYHKVCGKDVIHSDDVNMSEYFDWSGDNPVIQSQDDANDEERSEGGWSDLARTDNSHIRAKTVRRMRNQGRYVRWLSAIHARKDDPAYMQKCFRQLWAQYRKDGMQFMDKWDVDLLMNTLKRNGARPRARK
jgi:hypothetical protein